MFLQNPLLRQSLAISLGAIGGSLSRYYITLIFNQTLGNSFPYGTFFINITGSFIMGLFITIMNEKGIPLSLDIILLISVGFLGSYTTFSSYELDSIKLLNQKVFLTFSLYWLGSAVLGLIFIYLGILLGRKFN